MNARDFAKHRALIERRCDTKRQRSKAMASLIKRAGASLVIIHGRHVGYKLPTGETVCVKERFSTDAKALAAMERIQQAITDGHRAPSRVYACLLCVGWHLTSQPPKYLQA